MIKLSSNTELAAKMPDLIDFDAGGKMISKETYLEELAYELMDRVINTASGKLKTHTMRLGQDDFIPWKRGPSL